jgi:hypothetical protein
MNIANIIVYALIDPEGDVKKVSNQLEAVTNYFPSDNNRKYFSTTMWNEMFNADTEKRIEVLNKNGWTISKGYYTQQCVLE